jgi:hypothetical protein
MKNLEEIIRISELSRTVECTNCHHVAYHCPSSGCNHVTDDGVTCECTEFSCPRPLDWDKK